MNSGEICRLENRRQNLLDRLKTAEAALQSGLLKPGLGSPAREHIERALAHVQEAHLAVGGNKEVRTVQQLVDELQLMNQACSELLQQPPPGVTVIRTSRA